MNDIIEIENFISKKEALKIIDAIKRNFESANQLYPNYYRNNDRYVIHDKSLANKLFQKIDKKLFPEKIVKLNSKIRFCRYSNKQEFSTHKDGVHFKDDLKSKYTFLLYLNDNSQYEGGSTSFYKSKNDKKPYYSITPKQGLLVVFNHDIWHKGNLVKEGNKYILRSDIYIENNNETISHNGYVWNLTKVDENLFLSGGRDKNIKLWNNELELIETKSLHKSSVIGITKITQNTFVSYSRDLTLKKWNLNKNKNLSIKLKSMILKLVIYKNMLITSNTNGEIVFYTKNLDFIKSIKLSNSWIWDISINNNVLFTLSESGIVYKINLDNLESKTIFQTSEKLFSIHHYNNRLYIGTFRGKIIIFNLLNNEVLERQIHFDLINKIEIQDSYIYSCSEDMTLRKSCIHTEKNEIVYKSNDFIKDFILNSKHIILTGFNGKIIKLKKPE